VDCVPHRLYTFTIPKKLRAIFPFNRDLLEQLFVLAHESLTEYLRTVLSCPNGVVGAILALHTFGEEINFHPHIHAIVADGLFLDQVLGTASTVGSALETEGVRTTSFLWRPETTLKPVEELFRAKVINFFVTKKLLSPEDVQNLYAWKHSGFSVHAGEIVSPAAVAKLEALAQYILRNPFSAEKMLLDAPTDRITYRSNLGDQIFSPTDFLAAITQHIPNKGNHTIRYYGKYSNKSRGMRRHAGQSEVVICFPTIAMRVPSKRWRELILRVWRVDPFRCPVCEKSMRVVAVITDQQLVQKILRHLNAWQDPPPKLPATDARNESWTYEPCKDVDPMPDYESFPD